MRDSLGLSGRDARPAAFGLALGIAGPYAQARVSIYTETLGENTHKKIEPQFAPLRAHTSAISKV